ncbi:hypothetical protein ACIBG7_38215 [Nonomuraea sp. NPDC050328]|uniref:hypothetical protein n=1 Tax=Nonomuraea sp. NPDC050328 TaxID=3364361 RepID=UPI0037B1D4E7
MSGARDLLARHFGGPAGTARLVAGLALLGTACSQHPHEAFSRVIRFDRFAALFPNWRFFAPTPAQHDFQFYYRTLDVAGQTSEWRPVELIVGRRPHQILWFPERRAEKAVFDLGAEILRYLDRAFGTARTQPAFRLLTGYIRSEIERSGPPGVKGFQFTLVRNAGYDDGEEPEILFVSPYTPAGGPR